MSGQGAWIDMTLHSSYAFLLKLANNSEFRRAFESDPVGVLAASGIEIPPEELPHKVVLPASDELQALIGEYLHKAAEEMMGHFPHSLIGGVCPAERARMSYQEILEGGRRAPTATSAP